MTQKWIDAAKRYKEIEEAKPRWGRTEPGKEFQNTKEAARLRDLLVEKVGREVEQFIGSEDGRSALALLGASKNRITFYDASINGDTHTFYLDVGGFHSFNYPGLGIEEATAVQAVIVFMSHGTGYEPEKFLPWLSGELDKIADKVK